MSWYPIARTDDAPFRHVYQAQLAGRELAVWRGDDGHVNVWDNRCVHRGVRLSAGLNRGRELQCVYHGWRFANRTGGCTYIPAHPGDAPARTICTVVFPAVERYGLIWTSLTGNGAPPPVAALDNGTPFALRSLPIDAPPELVTEHLAEHESDLVVYFVQPVDSAECVVHGVLTETPVESDRVDVWRRHALTLGRRRDEVESLVAARSRPEPMLSALEQIEPSEQPVPLPRARADAELRVVVEHKWTTADGIAAFELGPTGEPLPTTQPGSHIDVHLPNGLVRQYSLTNPSGETARYVIAVKLEPDSRGGSLSLHETVCEGDELGISAPRNNFTLRRDAVTTILLAGGIGITPLLAMAETLQADHLPFELHYFVRSRDHVAFPDRIAALGETATVHDGLDPTETADALERILSTPTHAGHAYICGPGPMLDAARKTAAGHGWPDTAVHFEYFKNTTELDQSSTFRITLVRSAVTLDVTEGETILEVLRSHGIAMPSSCEQGACGTCTVGVVAGEPVHQDVYLNPTERAAGDRIVTCVSRAASDELALDL